jgi:hypothetical protein
VSDIEGARNELVAAGIEVSDVFHLGPDGPVSGPDPSMAATARSPRSAIPTATAGCCRKSRRGCPVVSTLPHRRSVRRNDLSAMRRASVAHGEHEKRIGQADASWPDRYAAYMVAEQSGEELPS